MAKAMIYRDNNGNEMECELSGTSEASITIKNDIGEDTFIFLNKADLINLASDLTMLSKQLQPDGTDSNDNKA